MRGKRGDPGRWAGRLERIVSGLHVHDAGSVQSGRDCYVERLGQGNSHGGCGGKTYLWIFGDAFENNLGQHRRNVWVDEIWRSGHFMQMLHHNGDWVVPSKWGNACDYFIYDDAK